MLESGRVGETLTGHFLGADNGLDRFAPDLPESAAWGDERFRELMGVCGLFAAGHGLGLPPMDEPETFAAHAPEWLDLSDFGAVIFAGGFRPYYLSWLSWPDAFDELGFPFQRDGVSTLVLRCCGHRRRGRGPRRQFRGTRRRVVRGSCSHSRQEDSLLLQSPAESSRPPTQQTAVAELWDRPEMWSEVFSGVSTSEGSSS